jgi:hypothetical protein
MTAAELEMLLEAGYAEQADHYAEALAELSEVTAGMSPETAAGWLSRFNERLEQVRRIDARLDSFKAAWQQIGQGPGERLAGLLTRIGELIRATQTRVARILSELQSQQQLLTPQLDGAIHTERGRRAYQAAGLRQADA